MTRLTFVEGEYTTKKCKTRREVFLEKMDTLIPWKRIGKMISRRYHKGETGRPRYPLSTMQRFHCLRLFYNLSDPAMWKMRYRGLAKSHNRLRMLAAFSNLLKVEIYIPTQGKYASDSANVEFEA